MTTLAEALRAEIMRDGPISVARFMAIAVQHPEHGYYRRGDPLGADGDFVTAPEIVQMFGELIGLWCIVTWRQMGAPVALNLIELGPGRGSLMADSLRAAETEPEFLRAVSVHLVESSPGLKERQLASLGHVRPVWHEHFATTPRGPMLLIANEFFDALPVRQFERRAPGWHERLVANDSGSGGLAFVLSDRAIDDETVIPPAHHLAPLGAWCEASAAALALAGEIGARLGADGGAALIVDYGPARARAGVSLQAVRRHRPHDVLADPGTADLSAHVDFESLARAAEDAGARPHGPVPQGVFLRRLGIEARAEALLARATPDQAAILRAGCRRLIGEGEMGILFKVLALAHRALPPPAGFEDD